jgi:hypothetical protein
MGQRYRKLPVEIEAVQFQGDNWPEIAAFVGDDEDQVEQVNGDEDIGPCLIVQTTEGAMRARPTDWLIRGIEGELYPCAHSVFLASYEPVEGE